jgi:DNA-binding NarL/FixJ family response regulator
MENVSTPAPKSNGDLSARELHVLEMASLGLRNAEIAEHLDVSVHAIKFHLAAVYRKLGVSNRAEAVVAHLQRSTNGSPSETT